MILRGPLFALILLAALILTRWPLAPKYLYSFDSVNFALALDDFNPALHQPQPPGYPLFVALTKVVHLVFRDAQDVMIATGILVGWAALVLLWKLASEMYGQRAGFFAALLMFFNPPFWFGGLTNQVRICLALGAVAVAFLAWRAMARKSPKWFYATCAALGLAAGFRPTLGLLLLPLVLFAWWYSDTEFRDLCIGGLLACLAVIPWLTATALPVGGFNRLVSVLREYSQDQFRTSAAFGAASDKALKMATQATIWNGLGVLSWIWAAPFVGLGERDRRAAFLAIWFVPIFVFAVVIHVGDPDQTLDSVSALCVLGGAVLAKLRLPKLAGVAAVAINLFFFLVPSGEIARASTYWVVRDTDRDTANSIASIATLHDRRPLTVLHYRGRVTWRQLAYYFPETQVLYLAASVKDKSYLLLRRKAIQIQAPQTTLPRSRRLVLVAPVLRRQDLLAESWLERGNVYYRDVLPGAQVVVGPYRLSDSLE